MRYVKRIFKNIMKVLITTNVPSPYRVDFFNELGKFCDLTVTFQKTTSKERDKSWKNYKFVNFNAVFLKGVSIRADQAFCFGYKRLLKNNYDVILSMDCGTPSGAIFADYLAKKKIPFYIETDGCFYYEPKGFLKKSGVYAIITEVLSKSASSAFLSKIDDFSNKTQVFVKPARVLKILP